MNNIRFLSGRTQHVLSIKCVVFDRQHFKWTGHFLIEKSNFNAQRSYGYLGIALWSDFVSIPCACARATFRYKSLILFSFPLRAPELFCCPGVVVHFNYTKICSLKYPSSALVVRNIWRVLYVLSTILFKNGVVSWIVSQAVNAQP